MLTEKPICCPICKTSWTIRNEEDNASFYACNNFINCQIRFIDAGSRFYLKKFLKNGGEVWWCSNGPSEVKWKDSGFRKLTFDPPYAITEERLKLLIVFS